MKETGNVKIVQANPKATMFLAKKTGQDTADQGSDRGVAAQVFKVVQAGEEMTDGVNSDTKDGDTSKEKQGLNVIVERKSTAKKVTSP